MKKVFIKFFAIAAVSLVGCSSDKLGYFNATEVLKDNVEARGIDSNLNLYIKELETTYATLKKDYEIKLKKYAQDTLEATPAVKEIIKKDFVTLQTQVDNYVTDANKKFSDRRTQLYAPLTTKIETIVKDLAKSGGYVFIFDFSNGKPLYSNPKNDLTEKIKEKLK